MMSAQQPEKTMATFSELRTATLAARERTQDPTFSLQVCQGTYDVVRAIPPATGRGKYTIDYQSAALNSDEALEYLNALGRQA
jgi:hypothetical protein